MILSLRHLLPARDCSSEIAPGLWVASMPLPFQGGLLDRARDAWSVLTGRTFAVRYPVDGELEAIMEDRGQRIV